jgi:hypothetical protein
MCKPKIRWFDDVRGDLRILKAKDWRCTAMDKDAWRLLVQEAKAHRGCRASWYGVENRYLIFTLALIFK